MSEAEKKLDAIRARIQGEWDNPNLLEFGNLSTNTLNDIVEIING